MKIEFEAHHAKHVMDALSEAWEHIGEQLNAERHHPELAPRELARLEWKQGTYQALYLVFKKELEEQQRRFKKELEEQQRRPNR